jgi:sulfopyruvate decarboxylase subunit alpha
MGFGHLAVLLVVRGYSAMLPVVAPATEILASLKRAGITLVASLPDQWLGDLIKRCDVDPEITHVKLAREDDGVGICAGAFLGGRKAALICQNAGVLLSVNALGGMAFHHQIPFLVLAAHRGCFDDGYYYQLYKGRTTVPVLEAMGLPYYIIDGPEQFNLIEKGARQSFLMRLPLVLLLRRRALVPEVGVSK